MEGENVEEAPHADQEIDPAHELEARVEIFQLALAQYVSTIRERFRLKLRRFAVQFVLAVLGVLLVFSTALAAMFHFISGVAGVVSNASGLSLEVVSLILGFLVLASLFLAAQTILSRLGSSYSERLHAEYGSEGNGTI